MNPLKNLVVVAVGSLVSSLAVAGEADDLIALDKAWGKAQTPAEAAVYLSDQLIAVSEDGMAGKDGLLKALATSDDLDEPYVSGDYKVQFVGDNIAVMVHSVGAGDDAHYSMHVWHKNAGKWQVVSTATVEADD